MKTETEPLQIFYVGQNSRIQHALETHTHSWISSAADMSEAILHATPESIWVASSQVDFCRYIRSVGWLDQHDLGSLLWLVRPKATSLTPLDTIFSSIVIPNPENAVLPTDELAEVIAAPNRSDLAIAAAYDIETRTLTIWRGDFSRLVLPASAFKSHGDAPRADFDKISLIDYGQTIRLGRFEASLDSLLYEYDSNYRRRLRKERHANEKGFGPSLRRLRAQKGLSREAFQPVAAKTIARIERQEVGVPRGSTLAAISDRLQVPADEIETY